LIAPLAEYRKVLGPKALLWIDDSHAAGILGKNGRGTVETAGLSRTNLVQTITFSKAFGVYGGAVLGRKSLVDSILARSTIVVGNTPLPLPLTSAIIVSLRCATRPLRKKLEENVRQLFRCAGLREPEVASPIVAKAPSSGSQALSFRKALLKAGIYPGFIQYPGGPADGYFRFALSSAHDRSEIERLGCLLATD